jgi:hypothetical protein
LAARRRIGELWGEGHPSPLVRPPQAAPLKELASQASALAAHHFSASFSKNGLGRLFFKPSA